MKPILVGQAPGPNTKPEAALFPHPKTSAGGRLCRLTKLRRREYLERFERVNLLTQFPGAIQNGDAFPLSKARPAAQALEQMFRGRDVILVGRLVATAFGRRELPFFEWTHDPLWNYWTAVIPHPSGRNHWYNNPENWARAELWWEKQRATWWPSECDTVSVSRGTRPLNPVETSDPSCEASI